MSITEASHLTKELFTHRGAGTLIRKGERFRVTRVASSDELKSLQCLLEKSFQRELNDDYFNVMPDYLFYAESWSAAAVIHVGLDGVPYMDKFVVTPEAQGEGVGAALWQKIRAVFPSLYWRSRADNPINPWYLQQSDRVIRGDGWLSFCYGIDDAMQSEACLQHAVSKESCWKSIEGVS